MSDPKTKLSHSSVQKYLKCAYSYKLHYVDRLRPTVFSAALQYGTALDAAFTAMLKGGTDEDALRAFEKNWASGFINNKPVDLPMSTQIVYAAKDFEPEVIPESEWQILTDMAIELGLTDYLKGWGKELYDQVVNFKKQVPHREFRENEFKFLNLCNWTSLRLKAPFFVKAYREIVIPRIKRVVDVQREIKLESQSGDSVTGFIDLVAEMDDGEVYILDNKTSSRPYEEDSVFYSPQLALYGYAQDIHKGGFIVINKNLKKEKAKVCSVCSFDGATSRHKTCPNEANGKRCNGSWDEVVKLKADIQMLLGNLPKVTQNLVVENFKEVNKGIKQGFFPRNLHSCDDFYGGSCPYKGVCYASTTEGLEKV